MKSIVNKIKEVIKSIEKIQAEDREMTEAEKAEVEKVLLSVIEQRQKELEQQ